MCIHSNEIWEGSITFIWLKRRRKRKKKKKENSFWPLSEFKPQRKKFRHYPFLVLHPSVKVCMFWVIPPGVVSLRVSSKWRRNKT